MYNDHWGGFVHTLDTSHPDVQLHLEALARSVVEMGFTYLKLDFTYAPAMTGEYHDTSMTPAQRVRAGYDAIRRGAGDAVFLLGCGAPLGATVGVVDGMRIGPDVAPWWRPRHDLWDMPGYTGTIPATVNAWRNTLARAFMHRRLWANDPDCLMLRHGDTDLDEDQVRAWAMAVATSGGMAVISDDLRALDDRSVDLLGDVLELGRTSDSAALEGNAARCDDLMVSPTPTTLTTVGARLEGDPERGSARVVPTGG
jgi:alpha-galactosidase